MANIFVWLALAVGPLAKKVLLALGIGWLTYEGITLALNAATAQVVANWNQMSGTLAQLTGLFGFSTSVGIILGALAARAALVVVAKLGKVAA